MTRNLSDRLSGATSVENADTIDESSIQLMGYPEGQEEVWRVNLAYAFAFVVFPAMAGCTKKAPSWDRTKVTSFSVDAFLDGPDGPRTTVDIRDAQAIDKVVEVLKLGKRTSDRKEQGVAVLSLFGNGEKIASIELTRYDFARINGVPYSVDSEALIDIIRRYLETPSRREKTHRAQEQEPPE